MTPDILTEKPDHVTEATADIDAPPADVYRAVTDYAHWSQLLGDVTSVRVEGATRTTARVRFRSHLLGHDFTLEFANAPDSQITFRGVEGPPGGRARGVYTLVPIDHGTRSRVTAELYLDVVGVTGWFVSESRIRAMRRAKLARDLDDVVAHFARRG